MIIIEGGSSGSGSGSGSGSDVNHLELAIRGENLQPAARVIQ